MHENTVVDKSMAFAVRIVRLSQFLRDEKSEYVLSNQLLRSGTSIGANIREAIDGISRKDFLNKMYIALKECSETDYCSNCCIAQITSTNPNTTAFRRIAAS